MDKNIYRQAAELLDKNHDYKLSKKERQLINTAIINNSADDYKCPWEGYYFTRGAGGAGKTRGEGYQNKQ